MQIDMHYYATFFLAEYAGIPLEDVKKIAYSAQYVDDSTKYDSEQHEDGGLLYGIASAHHPLSCVRDSIIDKNEQRRVWVPFHFLPGGGGKNFEENLICVKNSAIAIEMMKNHISKSEKDFQAYLVGVGCHVFMDTFSHYGFSGINSQYNSVNEKSLNAKDAGLRAFVEEKIGKFLLKFKIERVASFFAQKSTGSLGHGGAMTFPDCPYLHWNLEFEEQHPKHSEVTDRDNQETFLEGCKELYKHLGSFANKRYGISSPDFNDIEDKIKAILAFVGDKNERAKKWKEVIEAQNIDYDPFLWEDEKDMFNSFPESKDGIDTNIYRFHQAVTYHRYYVLKDLLPKHDIAVY